MSTNPERLAAALAGRYRIEREGGAGASSRTGYGEQSEVHRGTAIAMR